MLGSSKPSVSTAWGAFRGTPTVDRTQRRTRFLFASGGFNQLSTAPFKNILIKSIVFLRIKEFCYVEIFMANPIHFLKIARDFVVFPSFLL